MCRPEVILTRTGGFTAVDFAMPSAGPAESDELVIGFEAGLDLRMHFEHTTVRSRHAMHEFPRRCHDSGFGERRLEPPAVWRRHSLQPSPAQRLLDRLPR